MDIFIFRFSAFDWPHKYQDTSQYRTFWGDFRSVDTSTCASCRMHNVSTAFNIYKFLYAMLYLQLWVCRMFASLTWARDHKKWSLLHLFTDRSPQQQQHCSSTLRRWELVSPSQPVQWTRIRSPLPHTLWPVPVVTLSHLPTLCTFRSRMLGETSSIDTAKQILYNSTSAC